MTAAHVNPQSTSVAQSYMFVVMDQLFGFSGFWGYLAQLQLQSWTGLMDECEGLGFTWCVVEVDLQSASAVDFDVLVVVGELLWLFGSSRAELHGKGDRRHDCFCDEKAEYVCGRGRAILRWLFGFGRVAFNVELVKT